MEEGSHPGTEPPEPWGTPVQDEPRSLHPRSVILWRLSALLGGAAVVVLAYAGERLAGTPLPAGTVTAAVALLAIAHAAVMPPLRYRAWRFALRDSDIVLQFGVLFRTTSIVPHARIQHVDTQHGPLDRALGLAELVIYTAGTRGAIVTVPALGLADAESLRDRLADLSGAGDAV
jgi:uncharacterized protein